MKPIELELARTPREREVTYVSGKDQNGFPIYDTKKVPNPAYERLQEKLYVLRREASILHAKIINLNMVLKMIVNQMHKLQNIIEKCTSSIFMLSENKTKLDDFYNRVQKSTVLALDKIRAIERLITKYNSVKFDTSTPFPTQRTLIFSDSIPFAKLSFAFISTISLKSSCKI